MIKPFAKRRSKRRAGISVAMVMVMVAGFAQAAFGHASFPSASTFGGEPNLRGGTGPGVVGSGNTTEPYDANTMVTAWIRNHAGPIPEGGADRSPLVKHEVIVPAGWTSPACNADGSAFSVVEDASTNNTRQPGTVEPGWSCTVIDRGTHKVIVQENPSNTETGSLYFAFDVTTPDPNTNNTTYNCEDASTEGFIDITYYASGFVAYWLTGDDCLDNDALPTQASDSGFGEFATHEVEHAGGLARTVKGTTPPAEPAEGNNAHGVVATVGSVDAEFSITISDDANVLLSPDSSHEFFGDMDPITLRDTRAGGVAWNVTGQASAFLPGSVPSTFLGWDPSASGAGAAAGPVVEPSHSSHLGGLEDSSLLASAPAGHDLGNATLGAALHLKFPLEVSPGTYSTTITLTAI